MDIVWKAVRNIALDKSWQQKVDFVRNGRGIATNICPMHAFSAHNICINSVDQYAHAMVP